MKAIFVVFNQAYNEEIVEVLEANGQRGYTAWQDIQGRGSVDGIPHLGNHAWPEMNHAVLTILDDDKVEPILDELRAKDAQYHDLGLRAYVWNIENAL
jgi:nitrogen regulatory protein PII